MTYYSTGFKARTDRDNRTVNYYADLFGHGNSPEPDRLRKKIRKQRNPQLFRPQGAISPSEIPADKAPPAIQAAFEETFGADAKNGDVILFLHPFFKRWTIGQHWRIRDKAANVVLDHFVRPIWRAEQPPIAGELPLDYRGNREMAHLRGQTGEYREPNKLDFIWIVLNLSHRRMRELAPASCDTVEKANQWAATKVNDNLDAQEEALERQVDCEREAAIHDWVSHNARLMINYRSRLEGSMQRTQSVPEALDKPTEDYTFEANGHKTEIEARHVAVKRDGYSYRARKGTEAAKEIEAEKANQVVVKYERQADGLEARRRRHRAQTGVRTL